MGQQLFDVQDSVKFSDNKDRIVTCLYLQEKLEVWLYSVRANIEKDMTKKQSYSLNTGEK